MHSLLVLVFSWCLASTTIYKCQQSYALLFIIDLVSKDIVEKWIKYLRNEFPTVAFKASTQQQNKNLVRNNLFL